MNKEGGPIGHWSGHPEYTKFVTKKLNQILEDLTPVSGRVEDIAPDKLLKRIEQVENEFRQLIRDKSPQIPQKDGRVAWTPSAATSPTA